MKRTICTLAIVTALAAAAFAAALQDSPGAAAKPRRSEQLIRIVQLKYTDANEVSRIVRTVGGVRLTVDQRTNSVIIAGASDELARVEELIAKLDRPATNTVRSDRQTRYFNLTLPVDDSTLELVDSIISEGTSIAADGKMLVVQGRERDLVEVTALVERLNETASTRKSPFESADPRSIETNFFFVTLSLDKSVAAGAAPLPAALMPVVDALAENGFYNPSLLAPLFVNVKEVARGDEFEISGQAGDVSIRVNGQVRISGRPESIDMSISANLRAPRVVATAITASGVKTEQRSIQTIFDIATTLNVKLDDYVVLAAAPSSTGDRRAIALVVRATAGK